MKKQIAGRHDINIDSQNNKTKSSSHSKQSEVTDDDDIGNLEVGQTSVGKPIQTGFSCSEAYGLKEPQSKTSNFKSGEVGISGLAGNQYSRG